MGVGPGISTSTPGDFSEWESLGNRLITWDTLEIPLFGPCPSEVLDLTVGGHL